MRGGTFMQENHFTENATLHLKNRESLSLDGVEDVLAFDETAITCRTILGDLVIEGSSLRIIAFCAEKGELSVCGSISALLYEEKRERKKGFLRRLMS